MPLPRIGIDSYAYHRWFGETGPWERELSTRWSTADFLDRASDLEVDAVSLQTVYLDEVTPSGLGRLCAEARTRGLEVVVAWGHRSGLEGGSNPSRLMEALRTLDACAGWGVELVRIVCGDQTWWPVPFDRRARALAPMLAMLADRAREHGLALAIENHADLAMRDLVSLVEDAGIDVVGICLDLGNAVRVGDDLLEAATLAAPYVRMLHIKDLAVQAESVGDPAAWWPTVPLGKGDLPVAEAVSITRASPHSARWFVEMAAMHPDHPDEDAAVAESLTVLRSLAATS